MLTALLLLVAGGAASVSAQSGGFTCWATEADVEVDSKFLLGLAEGGGTTGCPDSLEIAVADIDGKVDSRTKIYGAEFQDDYIDYNIVGVTSDPDPETAQLSSFVVTYADGRTLEFRMDQVEVLSRWPSSLPGPAIRVEMLEEGMFGTTGFTKSDGFIRPDVDLLSWSEAPNLVLIRTEIQQFWELTQMRVKFAELVHIFTQNLSRYSGPLGAMGDVKSMREIKDADARIFKTSRELRRAAGLDN